jgi:hypothetical protein
MRSRGGRVIPAKGVHFDSRDDMDDDAAGAVRTARPDAPEDRRRQG